MTKGKGYLLPAGEATEDELECCLVFYPARDEYRRALMGSLDYLATWIAWERDSEKRGQDAAASWKLANIQTWECCSMGYCDDLLSTLDELLVATQALEISATTENPCCDEDASAGDLYTDHVVEGVGVIPSNVVDAGFVIDEDDWDGYVDYKCMIAYALLLTLSKRAENLVALLSVGDIVVVGVGAIVGAIALFFAGPSFLVVATILATTGIAAVIWEAIFESGEGVLDNISGLILANLDELACAFMTGDGALASTNALKSKMDELFSGTEATIMKNLNILATAKALYSGRYDQTNIAQLMADAGMDTADYDCTCTFGYDFLGVWDDDFVSPDFLWHNRVQFNGAWGPCVSTSSVKFNNCASADGWVGMYLSRAALKDGFDWPDPERVGYCHQAEITYWAGTSFASSGKTLRLKILYKDLTFDSLICNVAPGLHTEQLRGSDTKEVQVGSGEGPQVIQVIGNQAGVCAAPEAQVCLTGMRVWGSVTGT